MNTEVKEEVVIDGEVIQETEHKEVAVHTEKPVVKARETAVTPMSMIQLAVEQGADIDKLEKLMALQERWEANEAKKAFVSARNAFKANPPKLVKDKKVEFANNDGSVTSYDHATLAQISDVIGTALAEYGLSHHWDIDQKQGGIISVTCVLTHSMGHSEKVTMASTPDQSGKKNAIQQVASTVTYLERYTLLAATGLAAKGMDDDGRGSEAPAKVQTINENQAADLNALLQEKKVDPRRLCKYYKIDRVEDLPASSYEEAVRMTELTK